MRHLSLGQRMRCDLAASNLHGPDILYLDEPTIGLDAASKLAVRDFIKRLNRERGTTVILTTHDMDDIEALCRRIIVIGRGEILFDGAIEELNRRLLGEKHLVIDLKDENDVIEPPSAVLLEKTGRRVRFAFDPKVVSTTALVVFQATASFWTVESLEVFNSLTYGGVYSAQYPLNVYREYFRKFFLSVVPMGAVMYVPICTLLGREAFPGLPQAAGFITPFAGLAFLGLASLVWRLGVRHYRSTGS